MAKLKKKNYAASDPHILPFMSYLKNEWINKKEHVSVYDCPTLTTDGPESFHRHNKKKLGGKHPCAWNLVDGIQKVLIDEELNYNRIITTAMKPKRRTPQHVIDRCNYINSLKEDIKKEKQRFNVENFLKMMPRSLKELQLSLKLLIGDDSDQINLYSIAPEKLDITEKIIREDNCVNLLREVEDIIPTKSCNPFINIRLQSDQNQTKSKKSSSSFQSSSLKSPVTRKVAATITPTMSAVNNRLTNKFPIAPKILFKPKPIQAVTSEFCENEIVKKEVEDDANETNIDPSAVNTSNVTGKLMKNNNYNNLLVEDEDIILQSERLNTFNTNSEVRSKYFSSNACTSATMSSKIIPNIFLQRKSMQPITSTITFGSYENNIKKIIINGKEVKKIIPIEFSEIKLPLMKPTKSVVITVQNDKKYNVPEPKNIENKENYSNQNYENHLKNTLEKLKRKSTEPDKWLIEKNIKKKKKSVNNKKCEPIMQSRQ